MSIKNFTESINDQILKALAELNIKDIDIPALVRPPETIDAEFALPCFPLAAVLRQSPAKIAASIASKIPGASWLKKVVAEGPYLNFKIDEPALFQTMISNILHKKERYGYRDQECPKTILVEYSSPNTNKPLHLGHVRNNVLGAAIVNLLKAAGHTVIPASILNDRGIHICKAMVAYRRYAEGQTPSITGIKGDHFVGSMYVRFEKELKEHPELMDEAREMLRDWENGDPDTLSLWKMLTDWVLEGFEQTYRRLGSHFDVVQHESRTYLLGKEIIAEGLEKGVFFKKEDNSVWIDLTDVGLDQKALLRQDGTSLYITQDLGVAIERFKTLNIDKAIYVVGSEQIYHFKALFETMKKFGFSWAEQFRHLSYGMVYLPEGKMKSREGKVVDADELMDQMQKLSRKIMDESHFQIEPSERDAIAEAIGLGAIKYYILKFNPQKDIHFDPEKSLSFDGATGAYIQYCHARIHSVLQKACFDPISEWDASLLGNREELEIIRSLLYLPDTIQSAAAELNPSKVATHILDLAKAFNVFYTHHRILGADSHALTKARLALSASVAYGLRSGLQILGIEAVEEM
ncbi:MAG: arginine--tRNA ligase [bacterium]